MKNNNPFTLSFGRKPLQYISRISQTNEIIESFNSENVNSQVFMISGVRGSGKTVFLSSLAKEFKNYDEWVVIDVSPEKDIIKGIAAKLYEEESVKYLFLEAKLNLSVFGIGVTIDNNPPIYDIDTALEKMLNVLSNHNKKVLVTIDEVSNTQFVREFVSVFQIFIRHELPIFLLMTGLYENIHDLQNEKTLTFLYRAPKIILGQLNLTAVSGSYKRLFNIENDNAYKLALYTKGYAFAYQVLGYLLWESGKADIDDIITDSYDQYLSEYVYDKLYFELSEKDIEFLRGMKSDEQVQTSILMGRLNMSKNEYSVYRDRLKKKGIINAESRGYVSMLLPRMAEYIARKP